MNNYLVTRISFSTTIDNLESSYNKMILDTMLDSIEVYGESHRTMKNKINTSIIDKDYLKYELMNKVEEIFNLE